MGDRLERLVILPFSIGCVSRASVDVSSHRSIKQAKRIIPWRVNQEGHKLPEEKPTTSSFFFLKLFKIFPQLFKEDDRDDDDDDDERKMEIGFPTDVKHVAHIGPGGAAMATLEETLSFRQFELAMAAQAAAPLPPQTEASPLTGGSAA